MEKVAVKRKLNSRAKGAAYELALIKKFRELGWKRACSSRSESRNLDASGVDICYLDPLAIQAKAVENLGSCHNILAKMPQREGIYNLVFHKKNHQGSVVTMSEKDFLNLLKLLIENNLIKTII